MKKNNVEQQRWDNNEGRGMMYIQEWKAKVNDTLKTQTKETFIVTCDAWSRQHKGEKIVKQVYSSRENKPKRENTGQKLVVTRQPNYLSVQSLKKFNIGSDRLYAKQKKIHQLSPKNENNGIENTYMQENKQISTSEITNHRAKDPCKSKKITADNTFNPCN